MGFCKRHPCFSGQKLLLELPLCASIFGLLQRPSQHISEAQTNNSDTASHSVLLFLGTFQGPLLVALYILPELFSCTMWERLCGACLLNRNWTLWFLPKQRGDRDTHFHLHSTGENLIPGPHLPARKAEKYTLQLKVVGQAKILRKEGETDFGDH